MEEAKKGNYEGAEKLIEEGDQAYNTGQAPHAALVSKEADGQSREMNLILTHAEDQMMSCEVFRVLAQQLIDLYKELDTLKK
ncbi:MAG: PTS lactose/cellobiose transporter subunit IIA [Solobacterium sp.]|nr:PTS lactose/cellobiose transporter subunit IIA [Solobacterium sp.]MCH4048416.1 PTS lactose/cellobiose transporter subunit IIA [Solobacterium sp.]MCH4074732.1 PTS lactose/cellobiose transporter subunit IIA [Solobacterium sp.]MCI1313913.1 PTS lactose/cellobiose transporter subunit IIA [Solobacterium sp.]MCI1346987.1 PTS lactose/cellobiose transporter subunit IIA [Solobacterium sp.]